MVRTYEVSWGRCWCQEMDRKMGDSKADRGEPTISEQGLRPCSPGEGRGDGRGGPRPAVQWRKYLFYWQVCPLQSLSTKWRSSWLLETALPMGTPGVRSMHCYQERALVPTLLSFVFGTGICTGVSEPGGSKCSAMKKTCKYILVPLPPRGLLIGLPLPSLLTW